MAKKKRQQRGRSKPKMGDNWAAGYEAYWRAEDTNQPNEVFFNLQDESLHSAEFVRGFWDAMDDSALEEPRRKLTSDRPQPPTGYNPAKFGLVWDPDTGGIIPKPELDVKLQERSMTTVGQKQPPLWQRFLNDYYKRHR